MQYWHLTWALIGAVAPGIANQYGYGCGFDVRRICDMIAESVKLVVTREEIRTALEKLYRRPIEDFTIIPSSPSSLGRRVRSVVCRPELKETKVQNIKALRDLSSRLQKPTSLMEGKWALENWIQFLAFVDEFNRFPVAGYGSGDDKGILK